MMKPLSETRVAPLPFPLFASQGSGSLAVPCETSVDVAIESAGTLLGIVARNLERIALDMENGTPLDVSAIWSAFYFVNISRGYVEFAELAALKRAGDSNA